MKARFILGALTALSASLCFITPSQGQQREKILKIELVVSGMTCTSCEMHIEGEVKALAGVSSVKASSEKGSVMVEFEDGKIDKERIVATINEAGYTVGTSGLSSVLAAKESCTTSSCQMPVGDLPKEISKDLVVLRNVDQIKSAFNKEPQKTRFVAILSSTCKWCLLGAESVQKAVVENMVSKDISVIIVWTNMLTSDEENTAFHAASLFEEKGIVQFFDKENLFGDIAAKAISPQGKQAWDIYMYFEKGTTWDKSLPKPFDYAHQLGATTTWADQTKYFCGPNLTKKLQEITSAL